MVGLSGSGDQTTQTPFTLQTFNNMLAQFGIKVPANVGNVQLKNVAAASVHADLPPFAKRASRSTSPVSSIGNAKSLRGGSLLMTPLKGIDGQVYAVAQGNLVVGGFDAEGATASRYRQRTVRRTYPGRRHRRTRGAERLRPGQQPDAEPQPPGLHHCQAHRRPHQRTASPGRRPCSGRRLGAGQRAARPR